MCMSARMFATASRVRDVRLAAAAALGVVGLFGVEVRSADQVDLVLAEVGR